MRTSRAKTGIFDTRIFYEYDEMESICSAALESVGLMPKEPGPVRIDRFVEKKFGVPVDFENLDESTLGYTKFGPSGVEKIVIAEKLEIANSQSSKRRLNSTIAHEAGHGLFHSTLFNFQASLFAEASTTNEILCRDELRDYLDNGNLRYFGEWWEFQANYAIGGLLLPKHLSLAASKPFLVDDSSIRTALPDSKFDQAVRHLAEVFDVNPAVSRIRLGQLFPRSTQYVL